MLVVSSGSIAGKEIVETLGLARGNTVRAKNVGKDLLAGLRTIVGGEIREYTEMLTEARNMAYRRMVEQAEEMGADAVDLGHTIHPHPTLSETVNFAAEMFEGTITDLMPPKKRK